MNENCFTHHSKPAKTNCAYCAKPYCQDCLLLTGELRTVMCKSCYKIFSTKSKQSETRRRIIIIVGAILLIPQLYFTITTNDFNLKLSLSIFSIVIILSIVINIIRIKRMKKFLISEKYK